MMKKTRKIKRQQVRENIAEVNPWDLFGSPEDICKELTDTQNAYVLGELAAEALVATYGAGSLNDFQIAFGKTGDWKSSFEKIFGINVNDFYIKLTPYLASQVLKFPN